MEGKSAMDQLVQSAQDAAIRGDKKKATELLKEVFSSNPNDIDALFVLATMAEDNLRKRQVLNRILSLDAVNKTARTMMLEMDRAEMSSYVSQAANVSSSKPQLESNSSFSSQSSSASLKEPMAFRYSTTWLIVLYLFTTIMCCAGISIATMNITNSLPFLGMALLLAIGALTVSSRVELNETGIQGSSLLGKTEMEWGEIASIKFNSLKGMLELRSNIGESVAISTQITGYKTIARILRQKRPDLFVDPLILLKQPTASSAPDPSPSTAYEEMASSIGIKAQPEPVLHTQTSEPSRASAPASTSLPQIPGTIAHKKEKPLIFTFPLFWRIFMYAFPIFFGCLGLLIAYQNVMYSLPFLALALVLGLIAMAFSPKVEITDSGIRAYGMLDTSEVRWNEISQMKSNAMSRKLELSKENGEIVKVSTQVSGYPRIVEIMRQKRPDLFSLTAQAPASGLSTGAQGTRVAEHPFTSTNIGTTTGAKTFTKSAFAQYGVIVLMIPLGLFGIWALVATNEKFVGIAVILIGLFFMIMSLFNVNVLRLEPNKLITESFFAQKEYTASQIREITMKTVRSRHGIATNYVHVQCVEGGAIRIGGFTEGDELVYGVLVDWWNTYRNR